MSSLQPPAFGQAAQPAAGRPSVPLDPADPVEDAAGHSPQQSAATLMTTQQLDALPGLPLAEHPDVYQRIHSDLQSVLADIDDA